MLTKGLRVRMFWLTSRDEKETSRYVHGLWETAINEFLDENLDCEIVKVDYLEQHTSYSNSETWPFVIIWYRKIENTGGPYRSPE